MTLFRDLIHIPTHVHKGDFVLRLSEGVSHPEATLRDYVVTDQLAVCFGRALDLIRGALDGQTSKATYLHGSFGSGKSHFMAILHLLLAGNATARSVPQLAPHIARHQSWLGTKKFLLVPYHMIGEPSMEAAILGGYVRPVMKAHPGERPPPVYLADPILEDAASLRKMVGDAKFFEMLGPGEPDGAGWGTLDAGWDKDSFEKALVGGPTSELKIRLLQDLVHRVLPSHRKIAAHSDVTKLPFLDGLVLPPTVKGMADGTPAPPYDRADTPEVRALLERNAAFLKGIQTWFSGAPKDEAEYRKVLGVDANDIFAAPSFAQLRGASIVIALELERRVAAGGFAEWLDTALRFHHDWDQGFGMPRVLMNAVIRMSGERALLGGVQRALPRLDEAGRTRVRELLTRYRSARRAPSVVIEDHSAMMRRFASSAFVDVAALKEPLKPIDLRLRGLARSRRPDFEKRFGEISRTVDARMKTVMQGEPRDWVSAMTTLLKAVRAKLEPRAKADMSALPDDALIDSFTARVYYDGMPNYAAMLEKDATVAQLLEKLSTP